MEAALNVRDFGAVGDGNTDDTAAIQAALDEAYGTADNPHGGSLGVYANRAVYFPSGWYVISRPLTLNEVGGAHIYGEGRLSTVIQNNQPEGSIFIANGMMMSRIERLSLNLTGGGGGAAFDLNWDSKGTASLQSNTFADVSFGGGSYGLKIGSDGHMGSEILVLNCYPGGHSVAGIYLGNYNAIAVSVIGGNIAQCDKGIWVKRGGGCNILGTGFQLNQTADIHIENGCQDGWMIANCRSESPGAFLIAQPDSIIAVIGCAQTGGDYFLKDCGAKISVINCYSRIGKVHGASTFNNINSRFDNPDWNEWYGSIGNTLSAIPVAAKATDFTLKASLSGTVHTNHGASGEVVFTLPTDTTTSYRIPAGTWFGFAVASAHPLTVRAGTGWTIGDAARSASSSRVGDYFEVMCLADGGGAWIVRSANGSWEVR